jgi:precorrin-6B methylase 2
MEFVDTNTTAGTNAIENAENAKIGTKLAPYNPTNADCLNTALDMLELKAEDVIYDLGCGDGRMMIMASLRCAGIRSVGIEYDGKLYKAANERIAAELSEEQRSSVKVIHADVLEIDTNEATKFFIYLVPQGMRLLAPRLVEHLRRGARIVTYVFSIPGLEPQQVELYKGSTKLYLYTADSIPKVEVTDEKIEIKVET